MALAFKDCRIWWGSHVTPKFNHSMKCVITEPNKMTNERQATTDSARSSQVEFYDGDLGLERKAQQKHVGSPSWMNWCCGPIYQSRVWRPESRVLMLSWLVLYVTLLGTRGA